MEQPVQSNSIKRIRTTFHAEERMRECGMTYKKLVYCLLHATPDKPIHSSRYKQTKYHGNDGVFYMQYETYVFTCLNKVNKNRMGEHEITLVLTVTDQRATLSKTPPGEGSW